MEGFQGTICTLGGIVDALASWQGSQYHTCMGLKYFLGLPGTEFVSVNATHSKRLFHGTEMHSRPQHCLCEPSQNGILSST